MFAAVGDLHLGKINTEPFNTSSRHHLQVQSVLNALERVFKWCLNNGVDTLVLMGDIFDTAYPSQSVQRAFATVLQKYRKNVRVIGIPGNHDLIKHDEHGLDMLDWIGKQNALPLEIVLSPKVMEIDGNQVFVCPHPFIDDNKKADWCIGHFAWAGARADNGFVNKGTNSPKGNWLLGDYHEYQEGDRYRYAGSLTQLNRQEGERKGFLAVDGKKVKFVPVKQDYHIRKALISKPAELDKLVAKDDGTPVYWWVKLSDDEVAMPKNWQTKYPQILNYEIVGGSKKAEKGEVEAIFQATDDPAEGLSEWLEGRLQSERLPSLGAEITALCNLTVEMQNDRK